LFTGLVQCLGSLQALGPDRFQITVETHLDRILGDLALGDSIATDGICLTVEEILPQGFTATASLETLQKTTLGASQHRADVVNLEPSLRVGSKLGGHFVTGHIDGIGALVSSQITQRAWDMVFGPTPDGQTQWQEFIAPYILKKGSVSVNGISLTVADCDREGTWFKVAVIPKTYQDTNLSHLKPGQWVNIEGDILGKYVEKMLHHPSKAPAIDIDFLANHGYTKY
jgi:riboflavin synthase